MIEQKPHQLRRIITSSLQVLLVLMAGVLLFLLIGMNTSLFGNLQLRTVMSGSMTPDIAVGSVALIDTGVNPDQVAVGDVITYFSESGTSNTITHRVIDIEPGGFITQGDANNAPDRAIVTPGQVIGTVNSSVPYVGYAAHAVSSPAGYWMLIIIPAMFVVTLELRNIYRELTGRSKRSYTRHAKSRSAGTTLNPIIVLLIGSSLFAMPATSALWTAEDVNQGNRFVAGEWYAPERIVINEVYYNVAPDKQGPAPPPARYQWIELYNAGEEAVSLQGWQLCRSTVCHTIHPNVNLEAGNFAILSHDSAAWARFWKIDPSIVTVNLGGTPWRELDTNNDMLTLKNPAGDKKDAINWGIPDDSWANYTGELWSPGINTAPTGASLERKEPGLDTDTPDDWVINYAPSPGDSTIVTTLQPSTVHLPQPIQELLLLESIPLDIQELEQPASGNQPEELKPHNEQEGPILNSQPEQPIEE